MLTKFFSTTKPSAIIVIVLYMTLGFFYFNREIFVLPFTWLYTFKVIGMWLLFLTVMFVLNFVSKKNDLINKGTYHILLFAALSLAFPSALRDMNVLIAAFLIIVALRRIISLRSETHMERKIFDATLWILIASLFVFYTSVYIAAIFFALIFYRNFKGRLLLIPLIATCCFSILVYATLLYLAGSPQDVFINIPAVSFDFRAYNNLNLLFAIAFLIGTLLWTIWKYIGEQSNASTAFKGRYSVVMSVLIIGMIMIILTNNKTGAEWYFVLPAVAVIVGNYIENTESLLFKESLLWLVVILPIIINIV